MKRSGGPTADEGASLTFTRQKRMVFGNQTLKKIQRAGISAQRGSWTVRCRVLAAYHMASQRLTLAYIFMCEYILTKSASLYLPSHSCIRKLLRVKGFSEVGLCPPAPHSSHWLKWDRKVFGPQKQLTESIPHVLPTALFAELSRNTMKEKSTSFKLGVFQADRNASTGLSIRRQICSAWSMGKNSRSIPYRGRGL